MRAAEFASRALLACWLVLGLAGPAGAGPREQARRLHDRLAGVPPSAAVLDQMAALIGSGNTLGAADLAMQNPQFLMTSLKNFVTPWTNVERNVHADLNDYSATVIGMIRDDVPFTQVLTADLVYVGANVQPGYSQKERPSTGSSRPSMPAQFSSRRSLALSSCWFWLVGQLLGRPPKQRLWSSKGSALRSYSSFAWAGSHWLDPGGAMA